MFFIRFGSPFSRRALRNRLRIRYTSISIIAFLLIQYLSIKLFYWDTVSPVLTTRLYQDSPLTLDLRTFSVCHPDDFKVDQINKYYHEKLGPESEKTCFIIEDLGGGNWWSYVSQSFAEILVTLKRIGEKSNISYKPFPSDIDLNYRTNLHKYFSRACEIDENDVNSKRNTLFIILIWNVNRLKWKLMKEKWQEFLENSRVRVLSFIDDLHFESQIIRTSRQYLFENVTTEIFSTYAYLFHNYYHNISKRKLTWFPHSASSSTQRSMNYSAENRLFVSGAVSYNWYPCRTRAVTLCTQKPNLVNCLRHPGYAQNMKTDQRYHYGGQRYFTYMRQFIFGLATCQSVHYAIAKLFEIPGNGLALVTSDDMVPILERLGLYQDQDFLLANCSGYFNFEHSVENILKISPDIISSIRENGQKKIFEQHLTYHRAQLLHVRLLAQALMMNASSDEERHMLDRWGRDCSSTINKVQQ